MKEVLELEQAELKKELEQAKAESDKVWQVECELELLKVAEELEVVGNQTVEEWSEFVA